MPTANATTPRGTGATAARKPAKARAAKATRAKSARTRAAHQTRSAARQSEIAGRETAGVFGDYAERAVLIPVGAALIARDRVVNTVTDTLATYSSTSKTQAQLRRFERRGATARNRLEREVRKARVRVERELRQRRREIEDTVTELEGRAKRVPELADQIQERILSLV